MTIIRERWLIVTGKHTAVAVRHIHRQAGCRNALRGSLLLEVLIRCSRSVRTGISKLEAVDLDGDSDVDFLLSHGDTFGDGFAYKPYHGVSWLENRGGNEFEAHLIGMLFGAHHAEAADLDADGDLDVVASGYLPQLPVPFPRGHVEVDSVIWFERAGEEWIPWSVESNHPRHSGVTVIDLNRDGRLDIVAPSNYAWERRERKDEHAMEVWFNLGPADIN